MLNAEVKDFELDCARTAGRGLASFIAEPTKAVGDLLELGYQEATILVHDSQRQEAGGLPMGCFLLASRITPETAPDAREEDTALILMRALGHAALPNRSDTDNWRFDAARRSIDSPDQWDADAKTDQFTLNELRHAGVRCSVLGTFRQRRVGDGWRLDFGSDISNFYSGQGMKVYKPMGAALENIVNFVKPMGQPHALGGSLVPVGRVRYSSTEIDVNPRLENVPVSIDPTDMLARRTALFGMSRSGKSNTIKTVASAIFRLRNKADNGRVGQIILDVNGEYANDNPQDEGCIRNIGGEDVEDVVTYGLFRHPHDPKRRLINLNFFGENIVNWENRDAARDALDMLVAGKGIIDEHLRSLPNVPQYVSDFVNTSLEPPSAVWGGGEQTRFRRSVTVYRAILAAANFAPPDDMPEVDIKGLFSRDFRNALRSVGDAECDSAADVLGKESVSWDEFSGALTTLEGFGIGGRQNRGREEFQNFNRKYQNNPTGSGRPWNDDVLNGLLSLMKWRGGITRIRELHERHSPSVLADYADEIVDELIDGKLVIVDQSIGSEEEVRHTTERIVRSLFNRQKQVFANPPRGQNGDLLRGDYGGILPPPDVIVYVEEAHNLIPAHDPKLDSIWARVAKEGSKYRIGLVYSTQEPSSILPNILKNTDNWFVAHLNNSDETRELRKYYDFDMFVDQILRASDTGFLRMRCLSNPYIVPVQIDKFAVQSPREG